MINILTTQKKYGLVFLVFAVAVIWSLYNVYTLPIWYDEVITLLHISGHSIPIWQDGITSAEIHKQHFDGTVNLSAIINSLYSNDVHPPLYFVFVLVWAKLFGNDLETIRLVSVLAVLLSGVAVYLTASYYKKDSEIFSLIIFFGAPMVTWSAVNARDYSFAMLFTSLALLMITILLSTDKDAAQNKKNTDKLILSAGAFCGLAFLSHYFTILLTAVIYGAIVVFYLRARPLVVISGGLIFSVCLLLAAPMLLNQFDARPNQYLGFQNLFVEIRALVIMVFISLAEQPAGLIFGRIIFLSYGVIFVASFFYGIKQLPKMKLGVVFIFYIIFYLLALLGLFYLTNKSLDAATIGRYGVFIVPILAILAGGVLVDLFNQNRFVGTILASLMLFFIANTWVDGKIDVLPWTAKEGFDRLATTFETFPHNKILVIVPRGYGRGNPGTWSYEMESKIKVAIVNNSNDLHSIQKYSENWKAIIVVKDETNKLDAELEKYEIFLDQTGYKEMPGNALYKYKYKLWYEI